MSKSSRDLLTCVCERNTAKVAKLLWCDDTPTLERPVVQAIVRAQGIEGNSEDQQTVLNNKDDATSNKTRSEGAITTMISRDPHVCAEEAVCLSKLGDKKRSALHFAVENGDAAIVGMILFTSRRLVTDADLALNALDGLGYAPLHRAAMAGRPDLLRLLLRAGADVNLQARVIRRAGIFAGGLYPSTVTKGVEAHTGGGDDNREGPINNNSGNTSSKVALGSSHFPSPSERPPLEEKQFYYSIQTPTALEIAQRDGVFRREECMRVLLSAGADVCPFQSALWVQ